MKIKVLFFGVAKDIVDNSSLFFDLDEKFNTGDLMNLLKLKYAKFSSINDFSIAVNEEYVERDFVLKENDVVAIIPPVSGG